MTIAEIAPTTAPMVDIEMPELPARRESETVLLRTRAISTQLIEVSAGDEVVGFLELTGGVWVALCGPVYSWATEVGQNLDPDQAVLALFANGVKPMAPTGLPRGGGWRQLRKDPLCP
jgi:hypothetical protein